MGATEGALEARAVVRPGCIDVADVHPAISGAIGARSGDTKIRPLEDRRVHSTANAEPATEIRSLDDWELALASGGEDTPAWP